MASDNIVCAALSNHVNRKVVSFLFDNRVYESERIDHSICWLYTLAPLLNPYCRRTVLRFFKPTPLLHFVHRSITAFCAQLRAGRASNSTKKRYSLDCSPLHRVLVLRRRSIDFESDEAVQGVSEPCLFLFVLAESRRPCKCARRRWWRTRTTPRPPRPPAPNTNSEAA